MSLQYLEEKNTSKYLCIKMSFYLDIVCKHIVCDVGLRKFFEIFVYKPSWHNWSHGLVNRFYDSSLQQLLEQAHSLFLRDLTVKVRVLLEVFVKPFDGLGSRETVFVCPHVTSEIQNGFLIPYVTDHSFQVLVQLMRSLRFVTCKTRYWLCCVMITIKIWT